MDVERVWERLRAAREAYRRCDGSDKEAMLASYQAVIAARAAWHDARVAEMGTIQQVGDTNEDRS